MPYLDAVEDLFEIPEAGGKGWLAVVDEVHTLSADQLRQLAKGAASKIPSIRITPTRRIFDEALAKQYLSNNVAWTTVTDVSVSELKRVMPRGVVSDKAWRVGLSPVLVDLFDGGAKAKVTTFNGTILALGNGGKNGDRGLAAIDVKRKVYACHCSEYEASKLCGHVLVVLFHGHELILDEHGGASADEWKEAFKQAQQHQHRRTMLCNWLYYFTKDCFARMQFKVGRYRSPAAVERVAKILESSV